MAAADSSPRPRRIGLVDAGAALAVLLAAAGVIWSPKLTGAIAKATGGLRPVTVLVDVRGIPAADPASLIASARQDGKLAIVIRNQPHGNVDVKEVIALPRRISTLTPDGKVVSAADPNQASFSTLDARFVLEGEGRKTAEGVVFGNQAIKVGAPIELEGSAFRVGGSVTGLKLES
ncbi:DUF4330 domain-containing protein [Vulcanococcus limneticus]|uniref:DUF4330 domain-containing protein n=1 Tax=Vulcanococcus limneticus TaxID=2170428 RepID=UPI000B98CFE5|nr:DUF4330 domain-containing protein [Vulcanococcus limneticus]MCP9792693.1 DUF4330 domain-containing protein [Vulcanococcus limneticus MW73D5]MCP9894558.1 DUF4330 domain-containing protein [Vulcanococcus limneticus Candia 3F8]MCP9898110.1 DUF4330 domain-containing protein [Vulcanococcus limneticus Candia 3B3]